MCVYVQKFSHRNICSAINPTLDLLRIQLSDSKLGHHRDRVQILGFPETRRRTDDFPGHVLRPEKVDATSLNYEKIIQHETDLEISLQFGYRIWNPMIAVVVKERITVLGNFPCTVHIKQPIISSVCFRWKG